MYMQFKLRIWIGTDDEIESFPASWSIYVTQLVKWPILSCQNFHTSFGASMKFKFQSIGSDTDTSLSKYTRPRPKKERPWWQSSVDTSEDFDAHRDGILACMNEPTVTFCALIS